MLQTWDAGLILLGWVCSSLYQRVFHTFFRFVARSCNIFVHEAIQKGFELEERGLMMLSSPSTA